MGVESRDFVDFGLRELHLGGKRSEMGAGNVAIVVLNKVQVLDEEVAPAFALAKERPHLVKRVRIDLPAFRRAARAITAPSDWRSSVFSNAHQTSLNTP